MNAHFNGRKPGAHRAFCRGARAALKSGALALLFISPTVLAQTNLAAATVSHDLPDATSAMFSLFRVLGALALVFAVFFGGLWLFRNWQRTFVNKGRSPKLDVLEVKSLGQRHALYVVGYEQQRMLVASSPAGITMLATLPDAGLVPEVTLNTGNGHKPGFADALRMALHRK